LPAALGASPGAQCSCAQVACGAGASPGGEAACGRWRSESVRRGVAGVAVSLTRPAVGCGLRPSRDFARCSAPRASSQDRGV